MALVREVGAGPGRLFVVSGPSGSGKSTLTRQVLARPDVKAQMSVSATTRPIRPGEIDGVDYRFLTRDEFATLRDAGEFLEWAEVHGNLYGTPAGPVQERLDRGEDVLLEIDVQGALKVRERLPAAVLVFVHPPDLEILERRLRGRKTDDDATIRRRLENARRELALAPIYDIQIVNEDLVQAADALAKILNEPNQKG